MDEVNNIQGTEDELNQLFKELLDGCRDDLIEAKTNVEMYLESVYHSENGKVMFGQFYNDALRIKGDARDRQIKILGMFKDRVTVKERSNQMEKLNYGDVGPLPDQEQMNKIIDEMEKAKKLASIQIENNHGTTITEYKENLDIDPNHDIEIEDEDLSDYEIDLDDE